MACKCKYMMHVYIYISYSITIWTSVHIHTRSKPTMSSMFRQHPYSSLLISFLVTSAHRIDSNLMYHLALYIGGVEAWAKKIQKKTAKEKNSQTYHNSLYTGAHFLRLMSFLHWNSWFTIKSPYLFPKPHCPMSHQPNVSQVTMPPRHWMGHGS